MNMTSIGIGDTGPTKYWIDTKIPSVTHPFRAGLSVKKTTTN